MYLYYTTLQFQSAIRPFQSANMGPYYTGARTAAAAAAALGKARKNKTMTRENTQPYYTTSSVISSMYQASYAGFSLSVFFLETLYLGFLWQRGETQVDRKNTKKRVIQRDACGGG
jgi:hypothetical protein